MIIFCSKNLRKAFKEEYKSSYKRYILTAFVPSDESRIDAGYQVKLVCRFYSRSTHNHFSLLTLLLLTYFNFLQQQRYLDYLSVATYDYTGPYDTKTGYNSPLYSRTHIQNSVVKIHFNKNSSFEEIRSSKLFVSNSRMHQFIIGSSVVVRRKKSSWAYQHTRELLRSSNARILRI